MTREEAYQILTKYLKNKNLIKHSLACEAGMKGIYKYLYNNVYNREDEAKSSYAKATEDTWGIVGLLHDGDYEMAMNDLTRHGLLLFDHEKDIPEDIVHAIKSHNPDTGVEPLTKMDWAIRCVDQLTGIITAAALVRPEKQLAPLIPETILKRMKEKSFARGANRESILLCEDKLQISLKEFVAIVLKSMQDIHKDLGL